MTTIGLKDDIINLKSRLEGIEQQLTDQSQEIQKRYDTWQRLDERAERIFNNQNNIVRFNVGGKKFATTEATLMETKGTLFTKLIESGKVDLKDEIFFDRSPSMFPLIIEYLRKQKITYKGITKEDLEILRSDAEYYQIVEIHRSLDHRLKEIEFVSFEFSGAYTYSGLTAGTNSVADLKDKSMLKGICANSPGFIIIELNDEWEFKTLEIGGWKGNSTLWYSDNGAGATIFTSLNKQDWKTVGTIPYGFGSSIKKVELSKSVAKYIKFEYTSFLGIGYLNIIKS
jgi:hypothetical protein